MSHIDYFKEARKRWMVHKKIKGTSILFWVKKEQVPRDKKVTYAQVCCDVQPEKEEVNRTRITAGGNLLNKLGNVITER